MFNFGKIECCNIKQVGRIYDLAANTHLIYIDSCDCCGQPIAEIKQKLPLGNYKTIVRRNGEAAIRLFEKYGIEKKEINYKTYSGAYEKEYNFINKFGVIYNENGVKIAPQDEFLSMTRQEINTRINKRFYKKDKIKI